MAKTPVSMTIDGYKEREVLMVTYEFSQATDVEGQMAGIPRGGKITVRVKALNDGFTNGYCINYEEKWEDKMGHFEEIEITCKAIEFGNVKYENDWA